MRRTLLALPLLAAVLLAACDNDDGTEPTPTIAAAISGAVTIAQGQSGTATVTVTRGGGYSGPVGFAVSGLPTGVTGAFDPVTAPAGTGEATSTLTLTASASAATGAANYTVTASGTGVSNATATGSLTVNAAPNFTLTVAPTTLNIAQGATGTADVTITRTGGFTGAVNLSVANLPTGVTAAFDDPAPTGNTAELTLTVASTATVAQTNLSIDGTGTPGNRSAALALNVTAAPTGGFTLALNPATVTVAAGANGQTTVNINKTGTFTANVTLAATGLPNGVTAAFNPPAASPPRRATDVQTQSALTLTVGAGVAANNYPIVVRGTAEGQPEATANLTLTVTAPSGGGNSSWKFCDLNNLPVHFAYQDGTGPWTAVTGTVAGDGTTYTFNIAGATGGVAFVQGSASTGFTTFVSHGTQAELQAFSANQCAANPNSSRTLNGSVAGVGATDQTSVIMGPASTTVTGPTTFQLQNALNGPADLIATQTTVAVGPPIVVTPVKLIIRRGVDIPDGGTIPELNFGAAEAFNPITAQITINNLGTDFGLTQVSYQTTTTSGLLYASVGATGNVQTAYGVPTAQQAATDLHSISVLAASQSGDARGRTSWFKTLADMTVTLGDPLTAPTITSLGNTPYPRYQATGPIQSAYDDAFVFSLIQAGAGAGDARSVIITATRGYFAGANYTLVVPDLSATTGWQNTWALAVGQPINAIMVASGFSSNGTLPPNVEGGVVQFATRVSQVTP